MIWEMLYLSQNSPNSWNNDDNNNYSLKIKSWPTVWHNSKSYTTITLQVYHVGLLEWLEMWNKHRKGWACVLLLSLSGNLNVCKQVCVLLCRSVHKSKSVCLKWCMGSKVGIVSCHFTSGCQWLLRLPAQLPLWLLESGDVDPGCGCVGGRWSPLYQLCPCHPALVSEGALAQRGVARVGGDVRLQRQGAMGQGRSRGSGCRTEPPSSAHTEAWHSVSTPASPPLRSPGECSPTPHMVWPERGRLLTWSLCFNVWKYITSGSTKGGNNFNWTMED